MSPPRATPCSTTAARHVPRGPPLVRRALAGAHRRRRRDTVVVQEAPAAGDPARRCPLRQRRTTLYQLLSARRHRHAGTRRDGSGRALRSTAVTTVHDVEHEPALGARPGACRRPGRLVPAASGSVEFRRIGRSRPTPPRTPACSAPTSRTRRWSSTVLVKIYRHVEAGLNPELEMLLFLTEHDFANIARARRLVRLLGDELQATLGISNGSSPTRSTGGRSRSTRCPRRRRFPGARLRASARSSARCTACSRPTPRTPPSRPKSRGRRRSACSPRPTRSRSTRSSRCSPTTTRPAHRGRAEELARAHAHARPGGRGGSPDPHPRRPPPRARRCGSTTTGVIADFEGEPARSRSTGAGR